MSPWECNERKHNTMTELTVLLAAGFNLVKGVGDLNQFCQFVHDRDRDMFISLL